MHCTIFFKNYLFIKISSINIMKKILRGNEIFNQDNAWIKVACIANTMISYVISYT